MLNKSLERTYPMVVIKLVVKEPSEKRKRRQLLPTPAKVDKKQQTIHYAIVAGSSISSIIGHIEIIK